MKSGIKIGQAKELEITVTKKMVAAFGGKTVHDLFSTSHLVHYMEWVARKTIEPYLEEHEEGMGCFVEVSHLMPTLVGMKVRLIATIDDIKSAKVICLIEAFNPHGKIAHGVVTQAIVEKSWLSEKINKLALVSQ